MRFYIYIYIYIYMDFCLGITPVPSAYEGQNGGIGSSGTGVTNSCEQPCAAGNQTHMLWKSS